MAPVWAARASQIGVPAQQAQSFVAATAAAKAALVAADEAKTRARAAVAAARQAMAVARRQGGRIIAQVRLAAESSDDPTAIYTLADITPARRPSRPNQATERLAPRAPEQLRAELIPQTGAIELTFKARQPAGLGTVTYRVQRQTSDGATGKWGAWQEIGIAGIDPNIAPGSAPDSGDGQRGMSGVGGVGGRKRFVDPAPRPGADGTIRYRLIAQCGWRSSGPSSTLVVCVPVSTSPGGDQQEQQGVRLAG